MAALTDNRTTASRKLGVKSEIPVAAAVTIYAGSMVMVDSAGYARPAAASVTNRGVPGVATAKADNASGAAGAIKVEVQEGEFLFAADTLGQDDLGAIMYADDDQTIDETQATNCPRVGYLAEYVSASSGWVRIGLAESRA
jgi:hypothetical protein